MIFDSAPAAESRCVPPVARLPELSTTNLSEALTCNCNKLPPPVSLINIDGFAEVSASALVGASETNPLAPPEPLVQEANCWDALRQT